MKKQTPDSAFPWDEPNVALLNGDFVTVKHSGMSIRDYFAGQVIMGLNANPDLSKVMSRKGLTPQDVRESFVDCAFKTADLMMKARR